MTTAADVSVRPARVDDVESVARVQLDAWRVGYASILPAAVLSALTVEGIAATWDAAIRQPPTAYHHLLVALEGPRVVGMAATGLAEDADLPAAGELLSLLVHPNWPDQGHGSRLLAACVASWRDAGRADAIAWSFEGDKKLQAFLEGAGFGFDGVTRGLAGPEGDLQQVRLRTTL